MLKLDRESADLIAAKTVQRVLADRPEMHAETVELTVTALLDAGLLDDKVATYLLLNSDRFCVMPPPLSFEAKWRVGGNLG